MCTARSAHCTLEVLLGCVLLEAIIRDLGKVYLELSICGKLGWRVRGREGIESLHRWLHTVCENKGGIWQGYQNERVNSKST